MNRTVAGLIGVVTAVVSLDAAQAASPAQPSVDAALSANSFADLLNPIPNAIPLLQASDAALANKASEDAKVELADYYYPRYHHHHYYRPYYHHHHHYFYHHHHHHYYRY